MDKLVVTNRAALAAKYGAAGVARIERALARLVRADAKRDVATRIVHLDDTEEMKALDAPRVKDPASRAQNKHAIDAVHAAETPDYLMILGAPDVVPQQSLVNPAEDEDASIPSDLPYACDVPYGRRTEDFLGPKRVVGRLPDLEGGSDAGYLVSLLGVAARGKRRAPSRYRRGFVLTAEAWKRSTLKSAKRLFGTERGVKRSPPDGPSFRARQLGRSVHLVNCHGAEIDPAFYGDPGDPLPEALRSDRLPGVKEGTVVAAECCYGAELYDAEGYGLDPAICNTYLKKKAYGYFGSTTVAYGPASGNGYADLVCIYFLRNVQRGASVGRAALEARQEFVARCAPLDPFHLKTLAQFQLYGDPSVHPARRAAPKKKARTKRLAKSRSERRSRGARRRALHRAGDRLRRETGSALSRADRRRKTVPKGPIADVVAYLGLKARPVSSFDLRSPGTRKRRKERFEVMIDHHVRPAGEHGRRLRRNLAVVVHRKGRERTFQVLISR